MKADIFSADKMKLDKQFKITQPIRLIELFAGYGSQALALKYLGVPFEYWKISEWAVKSIQAYKDLHFPNDNTDYSERMSVQQIREWLYGRISSDFVTAMSDERINRLKERQIRLIYSNMQATHNLGSICEVTGNDLNITETEKYCYILTYSFPCQDLSVAGKGAGMAKDSGTRSGLLWEVERLLTECNEMPQVLIMENVPQILSVKNRPHFETWCTSLEIFGYKSEMQIINAKEFGVPQNRRRCFMVSVPKGYYYTFPQVQGCKLQLKHILQANVDEQYYLPDTEILINEK